MKERNRANRGKCELDYTLHIQLEDVISTTVLTECECADRCTHEPDINYCYNCKVDYDISGRFYL